MKQAKPTRARLEDLKDLQQLVDERRGGGEVTLEFYRRIRSSSKNGKRVERTIEAARRAFFRFRRRLILCGVLSLELRSALGHAVIEFDLSEIIPLMPQPSTPKRMFEVDSEGSIRWSKDGEASMSPLKASLLSSEVLHADDSGDCRTADINERRR